LPSRTNGFGHTPSEIIEKLNKEINAGLSDPKLKARLADFASSPFIVSPSDFGKFIANEPTSGPG